VKISFLSVNIFFDKFLLSSDLLLLIVGFIALLFEELISLFFLLLFISLILLLFLFLLISFVFFISVIGILKM
jgi:hypothetical protein